MFFCVKILQITMIMSDSQPSLEEKKEKKYIVETHISHNKDHEHISKHEAKIRFSTSKSINQ